MKNDVDLANETAEWLEQGSRPLPSRVRDGTMSAVSRTRQLSPAHPRWAVRLARAVALGAAAAAAVIAVANGPLVTDGIRGLLLPPAGLSVGASASPAASASQGPAGKIAFYSDRSGNREIYVKNADGSGQTNVSHGSGFTNGPAGFGAWSPDGSRIAFTSDRDGKGEIYVVNADGSGLTNVSNDPCGAGMLAWSPDGSRIAFKGSNPPPAAGGCVSTIYVVNADGSGRINLTNGPAAAAEFGVADSEHGGWSPDGARFAFLSGANGKRDVYVVNADGSGRVNLSNSPGDDFSPAWSPDSSRVSFVSPCKVVGGKLDFHIVNADGSGPTNRTGTDGQFGLPTYDLGGPMGCASTGSTVQSDVTYSSYAPDGARDALVVALGDGKGEEVYVINADGSGLTRLTNNLVDDSNVVWSPDSSRIAWNRGQGQGGNTEIYVINADGSGLTRLSIGPEGDALRDGGWSPDSSRVAFTSDRDGNGEIYVVNADGSGLTNLTNNPGEDNGPVWSPAR